MSEVGRNAPCPCGSGAKYKRCCAPGARVQAGAVNSPTPALVSQLRRQMEFLMRSADSYDRGYVDEGSRIAVSLRILLHETARSTSLLTLLGAKRISLLSTVAPISERAVFADGTALIVHNSQGTSMIPKLDRGHFKDFVPRDEWWNQLVYVNRPLKVRRRDIILTAANKDGGAHVDPILTREYDELRLGTWTAVAHDGTESKVTQQQFIFLRQAAFEVLNSPDVLSLAEMQQPSA